MKSEIKNKKNKINIGLVGFGYIGQGVFSLLANQGGYIRKKIGCILEITRIAEKDPSRYINKSSAEMGNSAISSIEDILNDSSIDVVIELVGGLDPAFDIVKRALGAGKYVVTANKDMIANRGGELFREAEKSNVDILFEASVLGGIPIIGPLKNSLASNNIERIVGIVNGTTNYILTRMEKDKMSFAQALKKAQELGFAEKVNPAADIEGYDAACKLAILSSISFNSRVRLEDVYREGIEKITADDIKNAGELGYRIKLLAMGREDGGNISARVHPALIPKNHILASIEDTFNAVYVYGNYVDEIMSYGRGAGDRPTASSIVGDVIKIARKLSQGEKGTIYGCTCFEEKKIRPIDETLNKFYVLMEVADKPGVLARIAGVFGNNSVSINSMVQKQTKKEKIARIIFITHKVKNRDIYKSIDEIGRLDIVEKVLSVIRVEDLD